MKASLSMNTNALLNDFAIRSFRDTADQDYIVARMSYRAKLIPQFHWSSLQAVEKYLKCILLLNRIKACKVRHDLDKTLKHCNDLPFNLALGASTKCFIKHLDTFGRFRYLEGSFHVYGPKLLELDESIWEIRRYCQLINYTISTKEGRTKDMLPLELRKIANSKKRPSHKLRIQGGVIEKILDDKEHPARKPLIWQNFCFGGSTRRKVRVPIHFEAVNAPLTLHPDLLDEICKYVFLPNEVVRAYKDAAQ